MRIKRTMARLGMLVAAAVATGAFAAVIPAGAAVAGHSGSATTGAGPAGLSTLSPSAVPQYHVGIVDTDPCFCLDAGGHNAVATISQVNPRAAVSFRGPYHISADRTNWWEISTAPNLCLAWDQNDPFKFVYAESCQPGDLSEYWANYPGLQFENAAGNDYFKEDAWLSLIFCNTAGNICSLGVTPYSTPPIRWWEGRLP